MTADHAAIGFTFAVCAFALYKLLYGVDTNPLPPRRGVPPPNPLDVDAKNEPSSPKAADSA